MSKNLTRKGLALTAVVALGSSLFAGSPALAAGEQLTVAANSVGKELVVASGASIALKSFYNSGFSAGNSGVVKFKISTNGSAQVSANPLNGAPVTLGLGSTSAVVQDTTASSIKDLVLTPALLETESLDVTVQSWEDSDGSGTVDLGEWASAPTLVKFVKKADITFTPIFSVVRPGVLATTVVKMTSNINLSQFSYGLGGISDPSPFAAVFGNTNTTVAGAGTTMNQTGSTSVVPTYSSVDNNLTFTSDATGFDFEAGDALQAKIYFDAEGGYDIGDWDTLIAGTSGDEFAPTAGAIDDFAVAASASYIIAPITVSTVGEALVTTSATAVQTGAYATVAQTAGSVEISTEITAASGASAIGQSVTFTIAETSVNSLVAGGSVTSGAAILTNTNTTTTQSKDVTAVTDADGIAKITITYAGLTNTTSIVNSFTVTPKVQGVGGTPVEVSAASQTIGSIANLNAIGSGAQLVAAKDAAIDLSFGVVDNFGKALTGAGYAVKVTQGSTVVVGSVVNGVASVSFPAFTTTGDRTLVAQGTKNGVDVVGATANVLVTVGADSVASTLTYAGDTGSLVALPLNVKAAFVAADTRKGEVAAETTAGALTTISGNVYTSTGAGALTTVTLSGKGLDFVASGVYAKDTITVRTSATGSYSVEVRSSLAGTRTLTLTSGAVVRTQNLIFAQVGSNTGKTLTITGPDSIASGYSLRFAGKLVDKLGQPVIASASSSITFNVSYDGPGYLGALPTGTDVNGNFFVNVLLGAMDSGIATLTVTYDGDAAGSTLAAISATKTVKIGSAAAVTSSVAGIKGFVATTVRNASGKAVTVTVNGRVLTPRAPNVAAQLFRFRAKAGKNTVVVKVDGVTVSSRTVSVK